MAETSKMRCPVCGAQMNHHADKLVYIDAAGEPAPAIDEFHSCPKCGANATRHATGTLRRSFETP